MKKLPFHTLVKLLEDVIKAFPGGWRRDMAESMLERLQIRFALTERDFLNLAELVRASKIGLDSIQVEVDSEQESLTATLKKLEALIVELQTENAVLKAQPPKIVETVKTEVVTRTVKVGMTHDEIVALIAGPKGAEILAEVEAIKIKEEEAKEIEALLAKFAKDIEFMKPEDTTSTGGKRRPGKKGKNGKLKKLLAKYISINPKLMKEYKRLLDECFSIEDVAGQHVIRSIFGSLKPSHAVHTDIESAERYVKVLKTNHLNNNFCKDETRLAFDALTLGFVTEKFAKVIALEA